MGLTKNWIRSHWSETRIVSLNVAEGWGKSKEKQETTYLEKVAHAERGLMGLRYGMTIFVGFQVLHIHFNALCFPVNHFPCLAFNNSQGFKVNKLIIKYFNYLQVLL